MGEYWVFGATTSQSIVGLRDIEQTDEVPVDGALIVTNTQEAKDSSKERRDQVAQRQACLYLE